MRIILFLFISFNFLTANSSELINFKSGEKKTRAELLNSGRILVYLEKDCEVCQEYLAELKKCNPNVQSRIVFVSVNTPAQTQIIKRKLPFDSDLYVVKGGNSSEVQATPTTIFSKGEKVGVLKCSDLKLF